MKPRISLITLAVDDLERSLRFYRDGLGFKTDGIVGQEFEHGAVVFFELQANLKMALFSRANMAHDAGLPLQAAGGIQFTLGHNVASAAEVDEAMREAVQAGAAIIKPAGKTFWGGYAGMFRDPDGHLWEVAFNPQFVPEDPA